MARPLREAPPPLEGNDQLITAAGTIAWAVALVVLLILRSQLSSSDHWWIWTCVVGVGLGLFGLAYVPRLKRSRARKAARGGAERGDAGPGETGPGDGRAPGN
ncbi:MAG TPA: DUF2530 domain-containing protein [Streptosporangiaceae bacterium]